MAHDYMREYDEDRSGQRDRMRDDDRERGWRGGDRDRNERNLNFMLGDQGRSWERIHASSGQDDHYLSWRERQMAALDRDYEDYCREREQQFHSEFDSWRQQRSGNPGPLRTGMTQTGMSMDPSGATQAERDASPGTGAPSPMDAATLGTTTEDTTTARRRR